MLTDAELDRFIERWRNALTHGGWLTAEEDRALLAAVVELRERTRLTEEERNRVESYRKQAAELDGFPGTRAGLYLCAIIDRLTGRTP